MARIAAVVLLLLGLLPLANWIPGGHEAPWYGDRFDLWLSGGAILAGVFVIAAMALNRHPSLWRDGWWSRVAGQWAGSGWRGDLLIATLAFLCYAVVSQVVLSAQPLLIDEIIQVWQAQVFADGRLWLPTPEAPEFTSAMHLVDMEGRRFGQFPAGGPAMLMLGVMFGAVWLVGPVFAALGVLAFARLLRRIEPGQGAALAALLLLAFSPFWAFLAGSMMNHVTATAWLLVAALALAKATVGSEANWRAALVAGLALGLAATIRPMDGVAFAVPAGVWLLWRARMGGPHVGALLWSGVGVALPIAGLLAVNAAQTGDPFLFGYVALWGPSHELGFHATPWGAPHTVWTGIELVNLYLLRLQSHFLETPAPALLFATMALLLTRQVRPFDRWVLASSGLLLLAYFAYWHDGYYLGPRFLLPLAPWLALWTARLPGLLAAQQLPQHVSRAVTVAGVLALVVAGTQLAPIRARQYRGGMSNLRPDLDSLLVANGVTSGTVLVRESWGAQLIARMWGIGVGRTEAEGIYRTTDACALDRGLRTVEQSGGNAAMVVQELAATRRDSSRLVGLTAAPDTTLRGLPGSAWTDECVMMVREDEAGFALFAPALLVRQPGVSVVHDLHRRPPATRAPYFLLRRNGTTVESPFEILELDPDSLRRVWGAGDD